MGELINILESWNFSTMQNDSFLKIDILLILHHFSFILQDLHLLPGSQKSEIYLKRKDLTGLAN